jgi:hypothetical protein
MQRASRQCRLDDFLRDKSKDERHADIVDSERQRFGDSKVARPEGVRPTDRNDGANRGEKIVIRDESERPCHGRCSL